MNGIRSAALALLSLAAVSSGQAPIKVLFWGGLGGGAHDPTPLKDTLSRFLGATEQIAYRSANVPVWLHPDTLARFDVMLVYPTNQAGNDLSAAQLASLYDWVDSGHVIVALHGATNTFLSGTQPFRGTTTSIGWRQLLGAQFLGHGPAGGNGNSGTVSFRSPLHPALDGADPLPASGANTGDAPYWDEGRQHTQFTPDTVVIARSGYITPSPVSIPWIWIRPQGKGAVYYNCSGHDSQAWGRPEFKGQIRAALTWGAGVGRPTGLRGRFPRNPGDKAPKTPGISHLIRGSEVRGLWVPDLNGRNVFVGNLNGIYVKKP